MNFHRRHPRNRLGLDLESGNPVVRGKAIQSVKVKVVKTKKDEVTLKLTGYKFEAQHPLMDEAWCGPFSDSDFKMREGDTLELNFELDIPIKGWHY